MRIRVGTRGSELALIQTRAVCAQLRQIRPHLEIEEVVLSTHGDTHPHQPVTADDWPMGGFVGTIERALIERRIDFAVHSLKDLPTTPMPGTNIAAVPMREAAHDVLITAKPVTLDAIPEGMRIGTSSPRRAAQLRRLCIVETVPIRGNVPTRLAQVGETLDGVILAAAGLRRLGLTPRCALELPIDRFLPAPGQGALAVQVRSDNESTTELLAQLNDLPARLATTAERALLAQLGGGCAAPVGAYAVIDQGIIHLRGQVFSSDGLREATDSVRGENPELVAHQLAQMLTQKLAEATT